MWLCCQERTHSCSSQRFSSLTWRGFVVVVLVVFCGGWGGYKQFGFEVEVVEILLLLFWGF